MTDRTPPEPSVLQIERTFNAPAQAVFDAWTSAEVLRRRWPAGSDWETPVAEVDVRVGGRLRLIKRSPDGEEFGGSGEYLEITPPERLVFTWTWDGHEEHEGAQLIEVEFKERHDGTTTVLLTNRGLRDEESRRSHREGWEASFDKSRAGSGDMSPASRAADAHCWLALALLGTAFFMVKSVIRPRSGAARI